MRRALVQGAVAPGLSFLLGDLGLARTTAASGSLLLGTDAVLTVLLAVLVLRERVGRAAVAALALGLAGTVLVSLGTPADGARSSLTGNLLVLAAAAVLVTGLGALLAFNLGIGAVTASRAGLLFGVQPVAGTLTAVAALGEGLGTGQAAGGALIVLGVLVLARGDADPTPPAGHAPAPSTAGRAGELR